MRTIYVIGVGGSKIALEEIRKMAHCPEDANIVCVDSTSDIPIEDRFKSNLDIRSLNKIIPTPILPKIIYCDDLGEKKSHRRPYKYHR